MGHHRSIRSFQPQCPPGTAPQKRSPVREITFTQPSHARLVHSGWKNKAGTKAALVRRVSGANGVTLFKSAVEPLSLRGVVYSAAERFSPDCMELISEVFRGIVPEINVMFG